MKKIIFLIAFVLIAASNSYAGVSKGVAALDPWTSIPQNTLIVGATADLTNNYQTTVQIDAALASGTPATKGLQVIVQGSSTTSGDNNWYDIARFSLLAGNTAVSTPILGNTNAGNGTLAITSTNAMTQTGYMLYIRDFPTSSEIKTLKSYVASTTITFETLTVYNHAVNTPLWNTATSQTVSIPDSANRIRIIWDNTQDVAGSIIDVRSNISKVQGV